MTLEVFTVSEFGIKIKNISAAMLYEVNLGVRDYYTYTDAMLSNSLFNDFLKANGMKIHNESTRDIICLDYDFGSRSFEQEQKRINELAKRTGDEKIPDKVIAELRQKLEDRKYLYSPKSRDEIRKYFYENGVDIKYSDTSKRTGVTKESSIHYEMLFRTSAKAKIGQVIFINSDLYEKAYDWLTIGLGNKMPLDDAKIVEMSAYAPLTTSTIVEKIHVPVEDILILKDQDSFFETMANIVCAEPYEDSKGNTQKKCVVKRQKTKVKNTLWDGMMLIESNLFPAGMNGMMLIRNHLFKACGFRSYIQLFFTDWCLAHGVDYETYQVQDMFGCWHYVKDIKMITTDNAIKWKKFSNLMGDTIKDAYYYWCQRVHADGDMWGVVKTDHPSKLGKNQQLSYQMINTLPCESEDVSSIARLSKEYVELLKADNDEFEKYLRKNANDVNHFEMLADLYRHNNEFANSTFFRTEKRKIIFEYVYRMRKGKILVPGDNLTVCGNPYALLLYSVGDDYEKDPTFHGEDGCIQCYTARFDDGEYLAAFRNPHNSPNNVCYMHNVYSPEMERYFPFSENIMAVNCIHTDVQDRMNGEDFDSDFNLVTNQAAMVKCAEICYRDFPTIVNALKESGITYRNTKSDYAEMDNKFSKSRIGIGYSSNLAQLALTYYWTELCQDEPDEKLANELYDNFVILSVLAQVIIDGCKREYEIDGNKEIERISKMSCMTIEIPFESKGKIVYRKVDFPEFMKYTREIKCTKMGKERPQKDIDKERNKLKSRINHSLVCPMNWLEKYIDTIQGSPTNNTVPTQNFFIKFQGSANTRQVKKIQEMIDEYSRDIFESLRIDDEKQREIIIVEKTEDILNKLKKIRIGNIVTINRLIESAFGFNVDVSTSQSGDCSYEIAPKNVRKTLNLLYKMSPEKFLINFVEKRCKKIAS